ncbi:tRNA (cytidine(34)-2'-O)-methyltransferase [Sphingobium sp. CR28]|uniref:tRNA (cytidine(34)-2'-O)-methyltransferase n=1 Tax=Sphingobium sp. CR28 TaxID=3400272 RepID=UPI003FF0917D
MRIALFQPDIAGNVGTILRLAACWCVPVDIVMPCGFPATARDLQRAAMDYGPAASITRHADFEQFREAISPARIVALTSKGELPLYEARFQPDDVLLMGRESAGLPDDVHEKAAMRIRIPMAAGFRSLNLAVATGIALGEALRQTGQLPE